MSNIRVTYSGLIAFVIGIASVFLGLIFTIVITRRLTPEDFGIWSLLWSIVNYFLISEVVISFWATREIARGKNVGKTSIFSSLAINGISIPIFILYLFFVSQNNGVDFNKIILGVILLPLSFLSQTLTGINLGHKPQATSYGLLTFGILKIPLAIITVIIFNLGIDGIIISSFIALSGKILIQFLFAYPQLKNKFQIKFLLRWIKLSWLPIFVQIQNFISSLDLVLYSIITNSVIGVAYYTASFAVASIIIHSSSVSQALYPKLLAANNLEGIKKNLTLVLFFAIPLLGISIIFSKPALFALNPIYQQGWPIVIFLSFRVFMQVLRTIPITILAASENVDYEEYPHFKKLFKSNLFKIPMVLGTFNLLYIIILVIVLSIFNSQINEFDLVIWWSMIGFLIEIPSTIIIWKFSNRIIKLSLSWKKLAKFIIPTILFIIVYSLTSNFIINYEQSIYKFLPSLFIELSICIAIYLGITYATDNDVRSLFKSLRSEIFHK